MKKVYGIAVLLVAVVIFTALMEPNFHKPANIENLLTRTGLYGILGVGIAFVIITGGIDLSIGSTVGLVGTLMPWLLITQGWSLSASIAASLACALAIGLAHGGLVTRMRIQPFIVTLCGLMIYRGISRWLTMDQTQGFGDHFESLNRLVAGIVFYIPLGPELRVGVPAVFIIMTLIALAAGFFLNWTIHGRYLLALGRNEQAARFSGIHTDRLILLAYVICSVVAGGVGGILFGIYVNSIQPSSHGNFYELYAIAAAVLGGCSLRGGEGSILGVVIGAALMRVIYNAIELLGIPGQLEFAIVGAVILVGVIADELFKRMAARRRAVRAA
jgi:ribose transport system permease protein